MNRSPWFRVISFGLLSLLARPALAAPPNDSFSSPTIVSGFPATASGSNVDASLQVNESLSDSWDGDGDASVWFQWTSPTSGPVQIDTFGSDFDTMLAEWTGTAVNALTLLTENDQYNGDQSAVFVSVTAGTIYRLGVYGWRNEQGAIALHITNDMTSKISGTVTDGAAPLEYIWATAYQWNDEFSFWETKRSSESDASGHYTLVGLDPGTYRVRFSDDNTYYLSEAYSNAPTVDAGTDIDLPAGTTVSNINASLAVASTISGTVTDGATPLPNIWVETYRRNGSEWNWISDTYTDTNGQYAIGDLAAGTYRVSFLDVSGACISEVYSNAPSLDLGTDIDVPAGTTVSNINATLTICSGISGNVTDGVMPLEGIQIAAYRWSTDLSDWVGIGWWVHTDADGNYAITGLIPGTYRISFSDGYGEYLSEVYSHAPSLDLGTDIDVPAGTTVSNINAALATYPKISGNVTDGVVPLEGIRVTPYQWDDDISDWEGIGWWVHTDADGNYAIAGLDPGTYRVRFYDYDGSYLSEVYSNAPTLDAGTDIAVSAGTTVSNINAALAMSSEITGTITDDGVPLKGIRAGAYKWNGSYWAQQSWADSDASGNYTIRGLTPGIYHVWFWDNNGDYIQEAYSNAPTLGAGMDIPVPASTTVSNINASMAAYSTISGIVTGLDGSVPLQGARVDLYRWIPEIADWECSQTVWTDSNGCYSFRGLSSGTCRVGFASSSGNYLAEAYNDAPTVKTGVDVPVPAETSVSGINASLAVSGSYPSDIAGIRKVGADTYDLSMTGSDGRLYMLQWTPSLTGFWVKMGESFYSGSDTNIITLTPTEPAGFWRVILAP